MNRITIALISALCFFQAILPSRAAATPPEEAGRTAAEKWLALVDAGNYPESWQAMDPDFRKMVSQRKWKSAVTDIRQAPGRMLARKFKSAEYAKNLAGAPEGEYVVAQFDTAFERKQNAIEKVTLKLGQDLIWRVSSYAVK